MKIYRKKKVLVLPPLPVNVYCFQTMNSLKERRRQRKANSKSFSSRRIFIIIYAASTFCSCYSLPSILIHQFSILLSLLSVAYLNLGTSLIALGRCHEAASVLRDGTKLDGSGLRDRSAHENARISSLLQLGGLYADQGKLQRALAVYKEALHTLPKHYPPQVRIYLRLIYSTFTNH